MEVIFHLLKRNNFSSFVWREELNENTKFLFQKDRSPLTCFKVLNT